MTLIHAYGKGTSMSKVERPSHFMLRSTVEDRASAEIMARGLISHGRLPVGLSDIPRTALRATAGQLKAGHGGPVPQGKGETGSRGNER
jgi:hypothetical protein